MEPSGLVQEKPAEVGWIYLQASMQQQDSKRVASVAELSLQVSEESEPEQSRLRSKTVLKSPQRSVGMEGSTSSASCSRNWFLTGLRLGAYNEITDKWTGHKRKTRIATDALPHLPKIGPKTEWDERGQHNHKISWSQEKQHLENQKNETTNHIQPEKHSEIPGYRQHQRQQVENATFARNQHVYRPYAGGWR